MKTNEPYPDPESNPMLLNDAVALPEQRPEQPMVRTQIYLSRAEHEFVSSEAARRGVPMAAVIRDYIDKQMNLPEDAWANNPMLAPSIKETPELPRDGSINHDHYISGSPKKYKEINGRWEETPALPEDYYDDQASKRRTSPGAKSK